MPKPKNSALMIIFGVLMTLFLGVIYAWTMFRVEIAKVFPDFTAAQLSLNFTITMICFCLGGFFGGKLSAKKSQRESVRVSAVMLLAGFMGVSFMGSVPEGAALAVMYICYGAVSGFGVGIGYNACISAVSPWFPEKLGLISGVLLMGFGFGSLLLGLLAQSLSAAIGVFWVFRIYAVAIFAVLFAGSFFIQKPPAAEGNKSGADEHSLTPVQMLSRPSFWVYFLWNTIMASAGQLVINSASSIAVFFGAAAGFGLVVSIFNGAGRPLTGAVMDKAGRSRGMLIMNLCLIIAAVMLLCANAAGNLVLIIAGMLIVCVCYGGGVTISAKVISDLYGPEHYAVNFSLSNFCSIPAAFIGPLLSGVLQDRSGGTYGSTFIMLLVLSLVALAAVFVLNLLIKREVRA